MIETRTRYQPEITSPPGETLALLLEDRGMTQADLALRTGRPRKTINEIIKAKATQFKKGDLPHNCYHEVGRESLRRDTDEPVVRVV